MTRDEILNMPAGREMDEEITMHIISNDGFWHGVKPYSTDIAAAWEVVEKMKDDCWELRFLTGDYEVSFQTGNSVETMRFFSAVAPTAPLAICRAALDTLRARK